MAPAAPVYLMDISCFRPPEEWRSDEEKAKELIPLQNIYNAEEVDFMDRIYRKSGLGKKETFIPPWLNPAVCGLKWEIGLDLAEKECRTCVLGAVQGLFEKTGLKPDDIDILVTACSIYCPTPSMASMVVNHFKMSSFIQAYHLGGMGCSNGVVGVNLIADLLRARPNTVAMFVTTETLTAGHYIGHDRNRIVSGLLFRAGAASMIFTNKPSLLHRCKYELQHAVRVHRGKNDEAYNVIRYGPDAEGINGTYLGHQVTQEAGKALTLALLKVAPKIMTWRQVMDVIVNLLQRLGNKKIPFYKPNFTKSQVSHFLLHAGGAKVLDGLGKELQLDEYHLEPSKTVLHDYGNVSSSSTWYTLCCIESLRGVRKGQQIMQVGVGSGIKCGVNIWKALRDVHDVHNVWAHRLTPEQRAAIRAKDARTVAARRMMLQLKKALSMLLMLAIFAAVAVVLLTGSTGKVLQAGRQLLAPALEAAAPYAHAARSRVNSVLEKIEL